MIEGLIVVCILLFTFYGGVITGKILTELEHREEEIKRKPDLGRSNGFSMYSNPMENYANSYYKAKLKEIEEIQKIKDTWYKKLE